MLDLHTTECESNDASARTTVCRHWPPIRLMLVAALLAIGVPSAPPIFYLHDGRCAVPISLAVCPTSRDVFVVSSRACGAGECPASVVGSAAGGRGEATVRLVGEERRQQRVGALCNILARPRREGRPLLSKTAACDLKSQTAPL